MKNFEFEYNGKKLWYSRSLACNLVVFRKFSDGAIKILAHKRGPGCEFNKGLWNVQGGFIDFDESAVQCAIRETWEEVGIQIQDKDVHFFKLDTNPHGKRQTMIASHYVIIDENTANKMTFSLSNCEPGEVEEIKWIDMRDLDKYNWIAGQQTLINEIYLFLSMKEEL